MKSDSPPNHCDLALLALAVLNQARLDWLSPYWHEKVHDELVLFFNSQWYEDLCCLAGCHPDEMRDQLGIHPESDLER